MKYPLNKLDSFLTLVEAMARVQEEMHIEEMLVGKFKMAAQSFRHGEDFQRRESLRPHL